MKKYALLIGVEEYRDKMISRLQFARADATTLAERLRNRCSFDEVHVLSDETGENEPLLVNIVTALRDTAAELRQEDLFLFFFAGHGIEKDGHGYLLARDSLQAFPEHGSLSLELLRKTFETLNASKRIILLDACRNSPDAGRADADNRLGDVICRDIVAAARSRLSSGATTALLSACQSGQRAREWPAKGHGVFTYYLLDGMDGAAWHGESLDFDDLASYTHQEVVRWCSATPGITERQTPWYEKFGAPSRLILAKSKTVSPSGRPPLDVSKLSVGGVVEVLKEPALQVESNPAGAQISVNGRSHGAAPVELALSSGEYQIRAELNGYEVWERRIRFDGAGDGRVRIELKPESPPSVDKAKAQADEEFAEAWSRIIDETKELLQTEKKAGKISGWKDVEALNKLLRYEKSTSVKIDLLSQLQDKLDNMHTDLALNKLGATDFFVGGSGKHIWKQYARLKARLVVAGAKRIAAKRGADAAIDALRKERRTAGASHYAEWQREGAQELIDALDEALDRLVSGKDL